MFFRAEGRKNTKTLQFWNVHWLLNALGPKICYLLPFAYAITGCDTTSHLFEIEKGVALQKLSINWDFKEQAEVFSSGTFKDEIISSGGMALSCLYGGHSGEGLNTLCYRHFSEKVATNITSVHVHSLSLTAVTISYHRAHVYCQVQQWMGKSDNMDPENWGWL